MGVKPILRRTLAFGLILVVAAFLFAPSAAARASDIAKGAADYSILVVNCVELTDACEVGCDPSPLGIATCTVEYAGKVGDCVLWGICGV